MLPRPIACHSSYGLEPRTRLSLPLVRSCPALSLVVEATASAWLVVRGSLLLELPLPLTLVPLVLAFVPLVASAVRQQFAHTPIVPSRIRSGAEQPPTPDGRLKGPPS